MNKKELDDLRKMFPPEGQDLFQRKMMALTMKPLKKPSGVNINPLKQRQGECYMLSGSFVLDNKGWSLCHGIINPPLGPHEGSNYEHAWSEKKNIVYEAVFNTFYNKEDYYKVYLPKIKKKFTEEKTRDAVLLNENWGPW
jgi:hypothetical protein